jgi:hypothetical protein
MTSQLSIVEMMGTLLNEPIHIMPSYAMRLHGHQKIDRMLKSYGWSKQWVLGVVFDSLKLCH